MRAKAEKGTLRGPGGIVSPAERNTATGAIEAGPHITARHAKSGELAVFRVDRSPMNASRWSLALSCGHEIWITSKSKPKRTTSKCPTCARSA